MSSLPQYPRGNQLTETMPFTDRDDRHWLVYIEGVPRPHLYRRHRATLPARRLRFDSVGESRATPELPAGSPFLTDARLQRLLDRARPVPLSFPSGWQPVESPTNPDQTIEWVSRAREVGSAVLADWSWLWGEGADRLQALREHAQGFLSTSLDTALTLVARIAASQRHSSRRWRGLRWRHRLRPR